MISKETFKNLFKKWKSESPKTFEKLVNTDFETIRRTGKIVDKNKSVKLNKPQSQRYNGMTRGQFERTYNEQNVPQGEIVNEAVDSSAVESATYDPKKGNLDITFVGGGKEYRYPKVPKEVFERFQRSPSKGLFVNTVLKGYSNIGDPEVQKKIAEEGK